MEKTNARTRFWRASLFAFLFLALFLSGYSLAAYRLDSRLETELGFLDRVLEVRRPDAARLAEHFVRLRTLSESYLMERDPGKLANIESRFDHSLASIDRLLYRFSRVNDEELRQLAGRLTRLRVGLATDARAAFRVHRKTLVTEKTKAARL